MPARAATAVRTQQKSQRELEDLQLVMRVHNGDERARETLIQRYTGFVRMKASSYFIAGGEPEDLVQEGLIGLCKAMRDFRADKETSFRSFAELCVTRQIITAIKTATRYKHAPLNTYVSFSQTPAGQDPGLGRDARRRASGLARERPVRGGDLDGRAEVARLLPRHRALPARGGRAPHVSRGLVLRGHGGGAGLRHEGDRQRPPARQAEDPPAPALTRSPA